MTDDLADRLDVDDPAWMADARCLDADPDIFFPTRTDQAASDDAKAICGLCPVVDDCLEYALTERIRIGVWGGHTPNERRPMEQPEPLQPCGTRAAYDRHLKAGEPACQPCLDAKAAYSRRAKTRRSA